MHSMQPQPQDKAAAALLVLLEKVEACFARKNYEDAQVKIKEIRKGLYTAPVPQRDSVFSMLAKLEKVATSQHWREKEDYRTILNNLRKRIIQLF